MQSHFDRIDRDMAPLRRDRDPLGAQAYASQLTGRFVDEEGALDDQTLARFLHALHRRGTAEAVALLRALFTVAPDFELRVVAGAYHDALVGSGVPGPSWEHDAYELVDAREFADVFGDQRVIACSYAGPAEPHALIGFVNSSHAGGHFEDLILTTSVDKAYRGFAARAAESEGLQTFERIDPAVAQQVLASALTSSFRTKDVEPEVLALRALLGARLSAVGSADVVSHATSAAPLRLDGSSFVSSDQARAWQLSDSVARTFVSSITEFGRDCDAGRVTRLSPAKIAAIVDRVENLDASALRAWVDWVVAATEQQHLPPAAKRRLVETLDRLVPPETARPIPIAVEVGELIDG